MYTVKVKAKVMLIELHLTATGCHLPYGITHCYLLPQPDLPTLEGWKAELT